MEGGKEFPLVSVIMPTYNGEPYIEEALFSVLKQTYPNIEVLVLDDKSQDKTLEKVRTLRDSFDEKGQMNIFEAKENQGIARNMNKGLSEANGKYIAILDQDDFWIDGEKLEKQVEFLETQSDYGIVGTNIVLEKFGEVRQSFLPLSDERIRDTALYFCNFLHSSVLYQKDLALALGGYDDQYKYTMDYDFFLRMMREKKALNFHERTTRYRFHAQNTSCKNRVPQRKEANTIVQKYQNDFPHGNEALFLRRGHTLLSCVFGKMKCYEKLKDSIKFIYSQ